MLVRIEGESELSWNYLIFDEDQITPAHKLSFIYEPPRGKLNNNLIGVSCEVCSNQLISTFCVTEKGFFCEAHDREKHGNSSHFRVAVTQETISKVIREPN